jgi:hypothetical protein
MEGVLKTLQGLTSYEVSEPEDEEDEDESASAHGRHAPPADAAHKGTSARTPRIRTWQHVETLDALRVACEAKERERWSRTT